MKLPIIGKIKIVLIEFNTNKIREIKPQNPCLKSSVDNAGGAGAADVVVCEEGAGHPQQPLEVRGGGGGPRPHVLNAAERLTAQPKGGKTLSQVFLRRLRGTYTQGITPH